MDWTINGLESGTNRDGWGMWYWIMRGSTSNRREVVGHGGFKTPPDPQGVVEIGYAIVAERRRCGLATEACRALIEWAFSHRQMKLIAAETFPNLHASLGVMKKLGMSLIGEGSEPDSIRYGITRERYEVAPGSPVQSDPQAKPR
jgi:RimJ/RimL family protein N-acetyltransferase